MAGIEVAHQLQPYAKYLLSSEEVTYSDDFPYESMVTDLKGNPGMDALQSITDIFNKYVARLTPVNAAKVAYTLSVVDLARVPDVSSSIRAWADLLAPGMSLFQKRDDPSDNVQILTKKQLPTVERFIDKNFIDLYHFGKLMQVSGVPQCLLTPVQSILDLIDPANKRAVILESRAAYLFSDLPHGPVFQTLGPALRFSYHAQVRWIHSKGSLRNPAGSIAAGGSGPRNGGRFHTVGLAASPIAGLQISQ
jgi:hypothetical protein